MTSTCLTDFLTYSLNQGLCVCVCFSVGMCGWVAVSVVVGVALVCLREVKNLRYCIQILLPKLSTANHTALLCSLTGGMAGILAQQGVFKYVIITCHFMFCSALISHTWHGRDTGPAGRLQICYHNLPLYALLCSVLSHVAWPAYWPSRVSSNLLS